MRKFLSTMSSFFTSSRSGFTQVLAKGARRIGHNATSIGGVTKAFARGFTLAEVLITLGIIGIVAAMTIPSLIDRINTVKHEAILKEDYSLLKQVMLRANDDGAIASLQVDNDMAEMKKWFQTYFFPYIKTANICYDEKGCWSGNGKYANGSFWGGYASEKGCGIKTISFVLNNGSVVCFDDYPQGSLSTTYGVETKANLGMVFHVDVNGSRQPNQLGKDIFTFVFDSDQNDFTTAGRDKSDEDLNNECKITGTGYWCATLAKKNNWKIPKF